MKSLKKSAIKKSTSKPSATKKGRKALSSNAPLVGIVMGNPEMSEH
jgi:hypothetical protein